MHRLKTGALLEASVQLGAACGHASVAAQQGLNQYAQALGVAFQVIDDVLDVTSDAATLGKTAGKDAANDKPTYVSLMGLEASKRYAQDLLHQALRALSQTGLPNTQRLADLAQMVVARNH
jgi:farnesyl diphosphate synthase